MNFIEVKLSISFNSLIFIPSLSNPCLINLNPCSFGVSKDVNNKLLTIYKSK